MAVTPLLEIHTLAVQSLASAGTAQQLSSTEIAVESVFIYAETGNAGTIYIGGETVDSTNGIPLEAGEHWPISTPRELGATADIDLSTIYFDGTVSADNLRVVYYKRTPG